MARPTPTAVNTLAADAKLAAADFSGLKLDIEALHPRRRVDLRPWLVAAAFLLLPRSIWLAGGFRAAFAAAARRAMLGLCACALGGAALSGIRRGADAPRPPPRRAISTRRCTPISPM